MILTDTCLLFQRREDALERASRVFGPDDMRTITIKKHYLMISPLYTPRKGKLVTKDPGNNLNGSEVTILRTTKDGKKYIVETQSGKLKVLPSQLFFAKHTPVSMTDDGETFTVYIDSFHEATNSYRVFMMSGVGDDDTHVYQHVHRYDVRVFFTDLSLFAGILGG